MDFAWLEISYAELPMQVRDMFSIDSSFTLMHSGNGNKSYCLIKRMSVLSTWIDGWARSGNSDRQIGISQTLHNYIGVRLIH